MQPWDKQSHTTKSLPNTCLWRRGVQCGSAAVRQQQPQAAAAVCDADSQSVSALLTQWQPAAVSHSPAGGKWAGSSDEIGMCVVLLQPRPAAIAATGCVPAHAWAQHIHTLLQPPIKCKQAATVCHACVPLHIHITTHTVRALLEQHAVKGLGHHRMAVTHSLFICECMAATQQHLMLGLRNRCNIGHFLSKGTQSMTR